MLKGIDLGVSIKAILDKMNAIVVEPDGPAPLTIGPPDLTGNYDIVLEAPNHEA